MNPLRSSPVLRAAAYAADGALVGVRAQFANNNWYHVALVFDGTLASEERARIYINGTLDSVHAESSAAISQYDSSLEVGRLRHGGDVLVGSLDEVAMWRRALTSDEIRAVFLTSSPL